MSLPGRFGCAKDLGLKEEAGVMIGALPTLAFGDRCTGEGRKGVSTEPGRRQQPIQGRKGVAELLRRKRWNEGGDSGRFE